MRPKISEIQLEYQRVASIVPDSHRQHSKINSRQDKLFTEIGERPSCLNASLLDISKLGPFLVGRNLIVEPKIEIITSHVDTADTAPLSNYSGQLSRWRSIFGGSS